MMNIPEKLIKLRKSVGLSQVEIAKALKMTSGAICNYEKGRRPIRAKDYEAIKSLVRKLRR